MMRVVRHSEKLWMPYAWKLSRLVWMGSGATWPNGRCPCPLHELEDLYDPFQLKQFCDSLFCDSIILYF